jgi:glycosyltransferase involved in cell wall biosynthesis
MASLLLSIFFCLVAALWLGLGIKSIFAVLSVERLPSLNSLPPIAVAPGVSVIIAVRDEASRIEKTVRQIMGQQGVALELIVVDDRSTDGTSEILLALQPEFPNLRVIRVDRLPPYWLGKCHAMHVGSQAASGAWLLFTDGDVWLKPDAVINGVAVALHRQADHLTLTPDQTYPHPPSISFRSCMLIFQVLFAIEMGAANRDRRNAMAGVGAFNLIRREAYQAIGGHVTLRMEVADDMKVGLLVGRAGLRSRVFIGDHLVEADWASTVWGIVKALEKNSFSALNFSLPRLILITVMFTCMWLSALLGPFTRTWAGWAPTAAFTLFIFAAIIQARRLRWPVRAVLLIPFSLAIVPVIFWNSALKTLRQGGIRWRDTFYPLDLLRQNLIKTEKSGPFSV